MHTGQSDSDNSSLKAFLLEDCGLIHLAIKAHEGIR